MNTENVRNGGGPWTIDRGLLKVIRNKQCPKCGKPFKCMDEDCWCHDYQILNKNVQYIRTTWNDCLCPECLKEFAEK